MLVSDFYGVGLGQSTEHDGAPRAGVIFADRTPTLARSDAAGPARPPTTFLRLPVTTPSAQSAMGWSQGRRPPKPPLRSGAGGACSFRW